MLAGRAVHLPPLRERGGDVGLLARRFLHDIDGALTFDAEAMDALLTHAWPRNVEELKHVVRRAAALADGPLIGATVVTSVLGLRRPRGGCAAARPRSCGSPWGTRWRMSSAA